MHFVIVVHEFNYGTTFRQIDAKYGFSNTIQVINTWITLVFS